MSSVGRRLLSALIYAENDKQYSRVRACEGMFKEGEVELYAYIDEFYANYGKIPGIATITDKLGEVLVEAPEPLDFYLEEVKKRFVHGKIKEGLLAANQALSSKDSGKALESLSNLVYECSWLANNQQVIDYRHAGEMIVKDFQSLKYGLEDNALWFGFPTLDAMTGGARGGDFITIIGRPGLGKTQHLLGIARKHWLMGGRPLFISMEMPLIQIAQRLIALDASLPLIRIARGELTSVWEGKMLNQLQANLEMESQFPLVDGDLTANVEDIFAICRQMHPTAVFVDGAYLLRNKNGRLSRWDRITDNAEALKQLIASRLKIPVLATYQFNRESAKKKKGEQITQDDVYGSDAIAQLSTIMLGLLENTTIEQEKSRTVMILKGRGGETGAFKVNWDFQKMNFDEIVKLDPDQGPPESEEMMFLD
jgi:replicative DNA helicase